MKFSHLKKNSEYLSLPVPTADEYRELQDFLFGGSEKEQFELHRTVSLVASHRPFVGQLIKTDAENSRQRCLSKGSAESIAWDRFSGVEEGYAFIVGSVTYVNYLRHADKGETIDDYLMRVRPDSNQLPVNSISEYALAAKHLLPAEQELQLDDATSMSNKDTYHLHKSTNMYALGQKQAHFSQKLHATNQRELHGYRDGFDEGVEHAIDMYVFSYEQSVIDSLEPHGLLP